MLYWKIVNSEKSISWRQSKGCLNFIEASNETLCMLGCALTTENVWNLFKLSAHFPPNLGCADFSRCLIEFPKVPMLSFTFESNISGNGSVLKEEKMPTHEDSI